MNIIRNDAKISKWTRITQGINIVGLIILGIGLLMSFQGNPALFWAQWLALTVGIICWQVGVNLGYRYTRRPRADETLDSSLKAALPRSTIYHYVLPADHVLLTRSGAVLIHPIHNDGTIIVSGKNGDLWRIKKPLLRRIFSQQPRLGNPTKETEKAVAQLVAYINEHAPELDEITVGAAIVATHPAAVLETDASVIPVVRAADLKKFMRKKTGRSMPQEQYDRLQEIFEDAIDFEVA